LDSIAPVRQLPSATLGDFVIGVTAAVVTPGDGMSAPTSRRPWIAGL